MNKRATLALTLDEITVLCLSLTEREQRLSEIVGRLTESHLSPDGTEAVKYLKAEVTKCDVLLNVLRSAKCTS